ncbi:MAG: metallophosphoesterase [Parachlamydiales bacterium]|jgi:hypothetical protein
MRIFALADLHLAFSTPEKTMESFGPVWHNYLEKIKQNWEKTVQKNDLVLLPGDISWAGKIEQAEADFQFLEKLPGTKLMVKGNHDHWWPSSAKLRAFLPPSIHFLSSDVFNFHGASIAGSRFWEAPDFNFNEYVTAPTIPRTEEQIKNNLKIYEKEMVRLKTSLSLLDPKAEVKIAMTHYPVISADLQPSQASLMLEKAGVSIAVFGHLHALRPGKKMFGQTAQTKYLLCSADFLDFQPLKIFSKAPSL